MTVTPEARWLHDLDARRATTRLDVPGGLALLHGDYPAAHDHNKLSVLSGVDGALLAALADHHLGGAGLTHRRLEPRGTDHAGLVRELEAAGYAREDTLVMTATSEPRRARPGAVQVVDLDLRQRVDAAVDGWRTDLPDADEATWRQLGERITSALDAASTSLLGVLDDEGRVIARADVFVHDGIGQVEEVMTAEDHRGRGLATALVLDGVARARAGGASTVLLVADVDDWPRRLYEQLGFRDGQVLPILSRDQEPRSAVQQVADVAGLVERHD